jgi:anti-sigma factor RsiW
MTISATDNDDLQINAYCDGELDPASSIEFERRLVGDEILKAQYIRLLTLRRILRSLPQYDMSPDLKSRMNSGLNSERPRMTRRPLQGSWSFQALAAAVVFGAVISSSVMMTIDRQNLRAGIASQVVAGHIRSLMAARTFDIASSDRRAFKPWFTPRVHELPQVVDLAAQGFTLVGGRVDVVGHDPVATIVYKHAAHTVSLTTLPLGQSVSAREIAGYNVRSWDDAECTYMAVSDLPSADLVTFERAFSTESSVPESN